MTTAEQEVEAITSEYKKVYRALELCIRDMCRVGLDIHNGPCEESFMAYRELGGNQTYRLPENHIEASVRPIQINNLNVGEEFRIISVNRQWSNIIMSRI